MKPGNFDCYVPEDQVELCEGSVCVKGHPEITSTLGELAFKANPTRGTVEPGVLPVPPAFAQALEEAFLEVSMEILESNLSPSLVYEYLKKAKKWQN
jgi:hypothetical protein